MHDAYAASGEDLNATSGDGQYALLPCGCLWLLNPKHIDAAIGFLGLAYGLVEIAVSASHLIP